MKYTWTENLGTTLYYNISQSYQDTCARVKNPSIHLKHPNTYLIFKRKNSKKEIRGTIEFFLLKFRNTPCKPNVLSAPP